MTTEAAALALVLDPEAFVAAVGPRDLGRGLHLADRRRTAVDHAVRALAAGYRLTEPGTETV